MASIYEGLNTIATSPRSARAGLSFTIHFIYVWLEYYLKTHNPICQRLRGPKMTRFSGEGSEKYHDPRETRKRIYKAEFASWAFHMIVKTEPFQFVDNGNAEELEHNYFLAIRSSYLTLHQGNKFIIESYSPHRFGRQFGYYQDVPGTLKYDTRATSLEEGLLYWCLCVLSKSSSKKAWWTKVHGTFLDDNNACLISPKSIKITLKCKKHEDKQVDVGENNLPHVLIPSIVVKCNPQAAVTEASTEEGSSHNLTDSESSNKDHHWKRQKKELTPLKATEASASRSFLEDFVVEVISY
ncbi:UNVERIFIED_CONTAM: hypothetical protein Slati_3909800 [Sesamum latifolium]|uniref:Aminotransferase-like plant mobile domain-containing protein n=1 Tax=Sesamum latifolium TaxID=2727402 RepID=A0AAW2TN95_9LAMI